jgi:glycine cleavage system transcriptional repressor
MKRITAITAVGKDRPGIVAAVSRVLLNKGCNIEDSSMTILCGEFAMILIVSLDKSCSFQSLKTALDKTAKRMNMFIALKELKATALQRMPTHNRAFVISVLGADKPGIVHQVSQLLAHHRVNITDLDTRLIGTKKSPVYAMIVEIQLPRRLSTRTLTAALQKLGKKMNVDIGIKPVETTQL